QPLSIADEFSASGWRPLHSSSTAGADGVAHAVHEHGQPLRAVAVAPGFENESLEIATTRTVTLRPVAKTLALRLRERGGRPSPGAVVVAADGLPLAVAGADGVVRFPPVDPSRGDLTALGPGGISSFLPRSRARAAAGPREIELSPPESFHGTVVDAADQ